MRGFRPFLLRGLEKMRGGWRLICLTHNLRLLAKAPPRDGRYPSSAGNVGKRIVRSVTEADKKLEDRIPSELVRQDESFADLVQEFLDGLSRRVAEMESALAHGDLQALRRHAHQLKGSGGGYGYPALTERAAELERQARVEQLRACQTAMEELKNVVSRVVVRLS